MAIEFGSSGIRVFSTCPQSIDHPLPVYLDRVREVAQWSEAAGCAGMLIYTDNGIADPWVVAQAAIMATERLAPLVAVQPVYMHPYAVAKLVSTIGALYHRKVCLNMVAGGFPKDLQALGGHESHDTRYARLEEYTRLVLRLLAADGPVTSEGPWYPVTNLRLAPGLPTDITPDILVSGSSEAGLAAAARLGATAVLYPKPASEQPTIRQPGGGEMGIRVGIITRADGAEAWRVARERFPEDRRGQLTHKLAMQVSDSVWHRQLSELGASAGEESPYWLWPFENYRTFCPYLVGSYATVSRELARYFASGYRTLITDIPPSPEELEHTAEVVELAAAESVR